jgi:hypothetical protein
LACPLCEVRKPKRYCPAKAELICAVCCGEKREVTIDCPSDCSYLISSRRWEREHRKPVTVAYVPFPELSIPMDLIREQQPLISGLGYTVLKAATEVPSVDDSVAVDALTSLAETYRTLGTGLYYERPPDGPAARAVYMHLTQFITELRQEEQKQAAFGGVKDTDIFRLLVFLLRVAKYETNGRPRSRAFLDFLRAQFPPVTEPQAEPSRIIIP